MELSIYPEEAFQVLFSEEMQKELIKFFNCVILEEASFEHLHKVFKKFNSNNSIVNVELLNNYKHTFDQCYKEKSIPVLIIDLVNEEEYTFELLF